MKDEKEFSAVKNSIQTRLSGVMLLVLIFALGINVFIFAQIRTAVGRIDAVFSSNTAINELSDSIEQVESTVYEYLNTNSSQALENYYRYEQNYRNLLEDLNDRNLDNEAKMLEKNIRRMSETYLDQTNETVQAKRGRNVEKYKTSYEEEHELYEYINSYSYNLNNLRFKMNSANYQLLLSAMNVLYKLCIAVMLVVYALGLVVTTLLVRNMIRPLTALSNTAHEVAKGNLNVPQLPVVVEDEVGIVTRSFNQMLESIRQNIEQLKDSMERQAQMKERELLMETHLKEAQLKYLQAQINPHFLYNTFETMRGIALSEHNEKVADIVKNISEFMRYNMYGADGSTSLQMELQHVTNYIRIMDYRFDDKIRLTMEIPEQMRALSMPKFTLQPIVENAVLHGFTEKRADCEICISGQVQDGAARLRIVDNGCGIAADALEKINADLKEPFQPGQPRNGRVSIGIYNVNSRLKLNYGDKYGVRIFSEVGVGTTAEIEFPAVMQKPGADSALRLRMKKAEQEDADS